MADTDLLKLEEAQNSALEEFYSAMEAFEEAQKEREEIENATPKSLIAILLESKEHWDKVDAALVFLYYKFQYYGDLWVNFIGWISILILLVFGKKYWNQKMFLTDSFNRASYPIYLLHQSILVALAYVITQICDVFFIQIVFICVGSFLLTVFSVQMS